MIETYILFRKGELIQVYGFNKDLGYHTNIHPFESEYDFRQFYRKMKHNKEAEFENPCGDRRLNELIKRLHDEYSKI